MGRSAWERRRGPSDEEGVALGAPQGDGLGHELTEDEREVGDEGHHQGEGDLAGVGGEPGQVGEPGLELAGELGAAERRRGGGEEGDSGLDGGDEPLRGLAKLAHRPGSFSAVLHELGEPALAKGDDCDLGPGEHAVREHQGEDHQ